MAHNRLGVLVGMQWEAKLAEALNPAATEASGATSVGAMAALHRLKKAQVDTIISFGFAAGLDPVMKAGTILLPHSVFVDHRDYKIDPVLRLRLGSEKSNVKVGSLLHSNKIITSAQEKKALFDKTGCVAVDMESGLVAQFCQKYHISFAVLRVICDPATRDLPALATMALAKDGSLNLSKIMGSLLKHPHQIHTLLGIGWDMLCAYWRLSHFIAV